MSPISHLLIALILRITKANIITVDHFPDTEQLNYLKENWVQHDVQVKTVSFNSSGITGGRVGQLPYICYDFETCDLVSSRISSRSKRLKNECLLMKSRVNFLIRSAGAGCDHQLFIEALGTNITLCLFDIEAKTEPIVSEKFERLNVTIFNKDNVSAEISLSSLDLRLASGYVLEEDFATASGFILDGHFYGTVFLKDAVHFLEPLGKKSRDLHIFGEGLTTLIRR